MAPVERFCCSQPARALKSAEYRRIYQEGTKWVGPLFAAFCRRAEEGAAARVGYTTPRALGPAVTRNRIKRRLREAVRMQLPALGAGERPGPGWEIVFNPRRAVLEAEFTQLSSEVTRLFETLRRRPPGAQS